jgi:hypothetical protein
MPRLAVIAAALSILVAPLGAVALADPGPQSRGPEISHGVVPAHDDQSYGDRSDEDSERAEPDDRDFNLYEGDENEDGDSAHGPEEDEGWDIEEYGRSERA